MAMNVGKGITLIVGGIVIFLVFTIFAPVYIANWYAVDTGNFTSTGLSAWNMIPDMIAYGGLFLGIGIFIIGVLEFVGFKITPGRR
jgi:hypothetical protein